MKVEKETTYLMPEGNYTGTITSIKLVHDRKNGQPRESIRITISVDAILSDPLYSYLARADYYQTQVNDFIRDAKRVLGDNATPLTNTEGEIKDEHLAQLIGARVQFTVTHDQRPGHEHAYRRVTNLQPERDN